MLDISLVIPAQQLVVQRLCLNTPPWDVEFPGGNFVIRGEQLRIPPRYGTRIGRGVHHGPLPVFLPPTALMRNHTLVPLANPSNVVLLPVDKP